MVRTYIVLQELHLPLEGEHMEEEEAKQEKKGDIPDIVVSGEEPSRVRTLQTAGLNRLLYAPCCRLLDGYVHLGETQEAYTTNCHLDYSPRHE